MVQCGTIAARIRFERKKVPMAIVGGFDVHRNQITWKSLDQVELATAEWVDWWNQRRLHSALGGVPPAECEAFYRRHLEAPDAA